MNFFNYYSPADEGGLIWTPTEATVVELTPVPMPTKVSNAWPKGVVPLNDGGLLLKAGTPLYVKSGAWFPSNSSTSGKRIIVAEDYAYHPSDPIQNCLVPCITKGFVDQARAETAYGYSYASADKSGFGSQGIVLAAADFGSGGGIPAPTGSSSQDWARYLGWQSGAPYWRSLTDPALAGPVYDVIVVVVSEGEGGSWSGADPTQKTLAIKADPYEGYSKFYFLDSYSMSDGWMTYTFKRVGGSDYFVYAAEDMAWTYHSGT